MNSSCFSVGNDGAMAVCHVNLREENFCLCAMVCPRVQKKMKLGEPVAPKKIGFAKSHLGILQNRSLEIQIFSLFFNFGMWRANKYHRHFLTVPYSLD